VGWGGLTLISNKFQKYLKTSKNIIKYNMIHEEHLKLDEWQKEFLNTKGDKILCCGRQLGKTEICGIDASEWAISHKNKTVLMIAPTERQAYLLFDKTLNYLMRYYKVYIKKPYSRNVTKEKIVLNNGVTIRCLPTGQSGIGIRGYTIGRLYRDECARIPDEVNAAVMPMLITTGGDTIDLSTPFGAQGEFHRIWINKDNAYKSYTRFSVNSEEVIRKRPICETWTIKQREKGLEKIEQAKARMSNKEFGQEYLGDFIEDLFKFFPESLIRECCSLKKPERIKEQFKHYLGVDIARMGEDASCFSIIEKRNNENFNQVDNIVTRKTLTTTTHDNIIDLDKKWNFARKGIGIDAGSGSLGVGVMDWLLRSPVKRKVVAINNRQRVLDHLGTSTQRLLKEDLYQNLLSMMQRGILKLLNDDEVIESLLSVQYEYVMKAGSPTKIRIFSVNHNDSDVVEGLIRACYLANQKSLNPSISWI